MAERWFLLLRYLCIRETLALDGRTQPSNESISMLFILHAISSFFFFFPFSFPLPRPYRRAWLLNRDNEIRAGIAVTDYGAARDPSLSELTLISHSDLTVEKSVHCLWLWNSAIQTSKAIVYPVLKDAICVDVGSWRWLNEWCSVFVWCLSSTALSWLDLFNIWRWAHVIVT